MEFQPANCVRSFVDIDKVIAYCSLNLNPIWVTVKNIKNGNSKVNPRWFLCSHFYQRSEYVFDMSLRYILNINSQSSLMSETLSVYRQGIEYRFLIYYLRRSNHSNSDKQTIFADFLHIRYSTRTEGAGWRPEKQRMIYLLMRWDPHMIFSIESWHRLDIELSPVQVHFSSQNESTNVIKDWIPI